MSIAYPLRPVIDLDGLWEFAFREDADFACPDLAAFTFADRIGVPGVWDVLPAWRGRRGVGCFRRMVSIPPGTRAWLRIGALGLYGKVFVDGVECGASDSPYIPLEVEVPAAAAARRELILLCCNRFDYAQCRLFEPFFDFYAYGGIYRHVELHLLPDAPRLDWAGVDTLDWQSGRLRVAVEGEPGRRELRLSTATGECLLSETRAFATGREVFTVTWPAPQPWSPESPVCQELHVAAGQDALTVRFGIRQVRTANGRIFLNDRELPKLLGYCRHEAHPQFGPALPLTQLVADVQLLRDLGCNFVRGSHYPQDPRFLELCDAAGLLVWEESLGWGQKERHFVDPAFVDAQLRHTRAMVRASYNHPCVIMRGFLNEGESHLEAARPCYEALIRLLRESDPGRLVTYATMFGMKDLFLEQVDVIAVNTYPGWYTSNLDDESPLGEIVPRLREFVAAFAARGLAAKPFLVSEIGAAALYGWRDPICAQYSEEYQAEYLRQACTEIIANPAIAGVALWQFCDGRTYRGARALGRPRAFNNKGTLDEYRRPKMAYQTVKQLFTQEQP